MWKGLIKHPACLHPALIRNCAGVRMCANCAGMPLWQGALDEPKRNQRDDQPDE